MRQRRFEAGIMEACQPTEGSVMTIDLTPEQEKIVKEELKSGHFRTAEELISRALHALLYATPSSNARADNGSRREAVHEMMRFAEKNRTSLQGVSVKELIHEGHRL
jgi:Arc/MetJ-type ribon-helix-helix transcriptional regulator